MLALTKEEKNVNRKKSTIHLQIRNLLFVTTFLCPREPMVFFHSTGVEIATLSQFP